MIEVVQPDHGKSLGAQRVETIMDRYFSRALLMGSMSFSCSNGSSSICESKRSMAPAKMR
jgi:hypothetical protein